MKAVKYSDARVNAFGPRGDAGIKTLIEGRAEDADNFAVYLQRMDEKFFTPRHRHNFDQYRVVLENRLNIGPNFDLDPGEMAYFPEGAHYGPQHGSSPSAVLLTLHVAGASRSGYINLEELTAGLGALKERGSIQNGVYTEFDASGKKRNKDSYEAVWEHLRGRELKYPRPRYPAPIKIQPDDFSWISWSAGVRTKHLGSFTECHGGWYLFELDKDARGTFGMQNHRCVIVVKDGSLVHAGMRYEKFSSFLVERGENCELQAQADGAMLIQFVLPDFRQ